LCLSLIALSAAVAAGAIVVCPKCGHEGASESSQCAHCGAQLPAPPKQQEAPQPVIEAGHVLDASGRLLYLAQRVVEDETALGEENLGQGKTEMACLLFYNASALDTLTDPATDKGRGERILQLIRRCQPAGTVVVACPACGGTGRRVVRREDAAGGLVVRQLPNKPCRICNGSGMATVCGGIEERKFARGRAESEYRLLQQGRKYAPVGRAWVPPGIPDKLSLRQSATLRRATAAPCGECMGFGRTDCAACKGKGYTPCPVARCVDGMLKVEIKSSWSDRERFRWERCQACRGTGRAACERCGGKGSLVCRACNGIGERAACARCGGEGFIACRRCNGTGKDRGVACAACGGEGVCLCAGCNGDGRRR
jgi:hypothetical protein